MRAALAALLLAASLSLSACGAERVEAQMAAPASEAVSSPHIVLDQFGYRPQDAKVAFVRKPQLGFDADQAIPSAERYDLHDAASGQHVLYFSPYVLRTKESPDPVSGDAILALDFTTVRKPGRYVIRASHGAVSPEFEISAGIYKPVLRTAFRTFYYQRAGIAKIAPFAESCWRDGASHLGKDQDSEARDFFRKSDASTARDLRGGWYDAGDYNQYTNWTADYVRTLMMSWRENPDAWGDDFGLPESGNGVPDVIDEALWGLDWLERMQREDGAVLSILGRDVAQPASAAKGPSYYGPPSTSATLSAAGTYALAALVLSKQDAKRQSVRISRLKARALKAWAWADANPDVTFYNNDARNNSVGLGAGQQEVNEGARTEKRIAAAIYLHVLTGDGRFAKARDDDELQSSYVRKTIQPEYRFEARDALAFQNGIAGPTATAARTRRKGYVATAGSVHWGSNSTMARLGLIALERGDRDTGGDYVHYLHGANPLGQVYLSNMGGLGAERSVRRLYHSAYSGATIPPPGFLVGGPNPSYTWDACCPSQCGDASANKRCGTSPPSPPWGQPPLKAYADFNDDWPLNSWQINENSNGYQAAYLRLLANFVE